MRKYMLTKPTISGEMLVTYNEEGDLIKWELNADLTPIQRHWFATHAPLNMSMLTEIVGFTEMTMTEVTVTPDLTFAYFWDAFNNKVGDKRRAEKLWNKLSDGEKMAAISAIPRYYRYLSVNTYLSPTHPATWLHQRRWENVYK